MIGGVLGELGPRLPFYAAAVLAFANFLFGFFVLPESLPKDKRRRKFDIRRANPFGALLALSRNPVVLWLLLASGSVRCSPARPSPRSGTSSPSRC